MEKDNGGAAFPVAGQPVPGGEPLQLAGQLHHGMSLRDYFAAHAPQYALDVDGWSVGDCARTLGIDKYQSRQHYPALLAVLAYEYADAMLKQRSS